MSVVKDVETWKLQKQNHCVVFKLEKWTGLQGLEKQTMEVGSGHVGYVQTFKKWTMQEARYYWESKVKEGYTRVV